MTGQPHCKHECKCFVYLGMMESLEKEPCVCNICEDNTRTHSASEPVPLPIITDMEGDPIGDCIDCEAYHESMGNVLPCGEEHDASIASEAQEKVLMEKLIEIGNKLAPYFDENNPLYVGSPMTPAGQALRTVMESLRQHTPASEPAPEQMTISFGALMGIHGELSKINDITSHVQDLLTPLRQTTAEHDQHIRTEERERVLDFILHDLSGRSAVGLALEEISRERGKGWLRNELLESLRCKEGAGADKG